MTSIGRDKYKEYLRSADWAAKRDKVMRRDKRQCVICGIGEGLAVHHVNYDRLGHEQLADLATFCDICHHMWHKTVKP